MKSLKNIKPKPKVVDKNHYLFRADCLKVLKQLPDKSIRLVITDPPYNINLEYGKYNDKKDWKEYYRLLGERLKEIARILTEDGSLYLVNYPETNAKTMPILEKIGLNFKRWLTWHYPTNIGHSKNNYTRSQRSILFYTKSKNNLFNKNKVIQPYKNPKVDKIKKLILSGKRGRTPYDTLNFSDLEEIFGKYKFKKDLISDVLNFNLLKNVSKERELNHPCQLPKSLLKVFIEASSKPKDFVLDCYAGTFTTSAAAKDLRRRSIGIEIDPTYIKFGVKRLKNGT